MPFRVRKGNDREVRTNLSGTGRHGMGLETPGNRQVEEKTDRQDCCHPAACGENDHRGSVSRAQGAKLCRVT
jgi:hypothetical protein